MSGVRQLEALVEIGDRRIAPFLDLAEVNVGEDFTGQLHFAWFDPLDVDHRDYAAHHRGKLHQAFLFQLFQLQRRVGSAEIDGLRLDLLDASARTDRLVVHAVGLVGSAHFA